MKWYGWIGVIYLSVGFMWIARFDWRAMIFTIILTASVVGSAYLITSALDLDKDE